MSTPYAHALSILRQTSIILSEQMSSVDLYALRSDTVGGERNDVSSILDKRLKDLSSSVPVSRVTQAWTSILASVAVPLVKFGQEMARVQDDITYQMSMVKNMLRLMWIMEAVIIILVLLSLTRTLSATAIKVDFANAIVTAGVMIVVLISIAAGFRVWASNLNEQYAEFSYQLNNALVATLLGYVNSLPATRVIVIMYALVTGRDTASELNRYNKSEYAIVQASQCTPTPGSASADVPHLNACESIPTMVTMPKWISENVTISTLLTIADALIDLKELGVDRFDRAPLWANVRSGVDSVRSLCLVAYDDEDPARAITRDTIVSAIQNEIAPILCIPGVELPKGAFGPRTEHFIPGSNGSNGSPDSADHAKVTGMTLLSHKSMSISQCSRAIIDSGGQYKFGYYDNKSSMCYACGDASVISSSFTSNVSLMAASSTSNQLIIARPLVLDLSNASNASNVPNLSNAVTPAGPYPRTNGGLSKDAAATNAIIQAVSGAVGTGVPPKGKGGSSSSSSSGSSSSSSAPSTHSTLYLSAVSMPWAMAATILDQSEELQKRILVVLKRYKFAIDLDVNRNLIDQALRNFYGSSTYESGGISSAIDTVLSDLKATTIKYRARGGDPATPYIDVDRMMNKISTMSNDTTNSLANTFQALTDAATSYVNLYAPFMPGFPAKVSNILALYGGSALLVAYATYAILARKQLVTGAISMGSLVQRIIVATCLLTVCLFVTETMLTQYALRSKHNWVASNDNSMMLVGATVRVSNEFTSLLQTIQSWSGNGTGGAVHTTPSPYNAPRAAAIAFLADCKGVVDKFDTCNMITSQQSSLPLPLTEILLYTVVGVIVLVFAATCVNSVVPSERIQSIGNINRLISRITDGDSSAIVEAQSIIECARVPIDLEKMMSWLGVILLAWITLWFASQSVKALQKYKSSLDASSTCR